ncbi:BamA/TamA family outer membrane protein [Hymenobacter busanensis]|uniref:BamA/TamA family outer membrane protein n=1 Tax=Hymenobacter busanensis TaxID=2607656 RepID=A0A7L5A1K2_9BACT|nr:BamA/TamA family outer membrane protein [Hymenobacter busanensis]KAA9333024.1 BamA/TamA family outer membrane protein [Hymenobacter busanensis]QHJ08302.1 BamA/TamA family outer membrane protein [Hymenobacter busanensis]
MYTRVLLFWGLLVSLLSGLTRAHAQTTSPVATPNLPPTQAPPVPPRPARPDSVRATQRRLPPAAPKHLRFETEAADQALLRRYRPRLVAADTLAALRTVRELVLALQTDAYLTASADELRWRGDTLVARLYVGEAFRWARLQRGNVGDDLLGRTGFRERVYRSQPFGPADLARLQSRILEEAENAGYPFAQVRLDSVQLTTNEVAATLAVDRGPVVVFDSLQIVGKTKIRPRFLIRYLQIEPNQPYSQQRVDAAARLLRQLPYLQLRAEPEVRFARGKARVYLALDDRNANQFDAIVGVLPNNNTAPGQKKVQITGDVTLNLRNLGGTGKQLGLQWRKVEAASQVLDAGYQHPNFFGSPLDLGATFNLFKQSDDFLTLRPRLQVGYAASRAGRLSVFVEQRNSRLLDTTLYKLTVLPDNVDSRYTGYGLDYALTLLDDPYFPRRGWLLTGQGAVGTKVISKNTDIKPELYDGLPLRSTQISLSGRVERYMRLGKQSVLLARVRGEALFNQRLFLNDLFRLGGLATLRGFNELDFYAAQYGVSTVELRQFTGPEAYFFLFADQAYLRRGLPDQPGEDAPTGLGAGLSFRTGAGVFQFVYSVGRTNSQPFAFGASKIHFGITSRF